MSTSIRFGNGLFARMYEIINTRDTFFSLLLLILLIIFDAAFALLLLGSFAIYLQILLPSDSVPSSGFSDLLSLVNPYVSLLSQPILLSSSLWVITILLFSSAIRIYVERRIYKVSNYISTVVSTSFFTRYISADYLDFGTRSSSAIISICHTSSLLLADTLVAIFQSFYAFSYALPLLAFFLAILPFGLFTFFASVVILFVFISLFLKNKVKSLGLKERAQASLLTKHLQESSSAFVEIKLYNLANHFASIYYNYDLQYRQAHASAVFYSSVPKYIIEPLALLFLPFVGLYCYITDQSFSALVAILGTTVVALQKLTPQFSIIFRTWSIFIANRAAIGDLFAYSPVNPEQSLATATSVSGPLGVKSLRLSEATFAYPNSTPLLEDINITLDSGIIYSLIGSTGAGKSTLTKLLMGLMPLSSGQIFLETSSSYFTVDCLNYNLLSTQVAYVPQDVFIFADSILYNITLNHDTKNLAAAKAAAKIACIDEYIESLPLAYQSVLAERGSSLSGGQKQRLAIARALYMNRPILILDESTSALDSTTENRFLSNISTMLTHKIVIFITHKPDQLRFPHCQMRLDSCKVHLTYISHCE